MLLLIAGRGRASTPRPPDQTRAPALSVLFPRRSAYKLALQLAYLGQKGRRGDVETSGVVARTSAAGPRRRCVRVEASSE